MAGIVQPPFFIIEGDPTEPGSDAEQISYIERSIRENPEAFRHALERLGETATAGTLQLNAIDTKLTTLEQGASGLLTKFFSKRYDMEVEYDLSTEQALNANLKHRELIETHRSIRSINSRIGSMKHEIVANPEAEPARDNVRRSRVAFFITRTIESQSAQSQLVAVELPSAG